MIAARNNTSPGFFGKVGFITLQNQDDPSVGPTTRKTFDVSSYFVFLEKKFSLFFAKYS